MTYLADIAWIQESVHRRYVSSMTELARLRKLQSNTPGVQFNTQINVGGSEAVRETDKYRHGGLPNLDPD